MRSLPWITTASLLVIAVIHLMPLLGVLGSARLATLYGLDFSEPNLAILMRHRAVLFGLLGGFFAIAAFRPSWQVAAFVVSGISLLAFLGLAWSTGGYNPQLARVVRVDLIAMVAWLAGLSALLAQGARP